MPPKQHSNAPQEQQAGGVETIEIGTRPEQNVRAYLNFLADPASALDPDLVSRLEAQMAGATDPVERLRLAAAIERARTPQGTELLAAFIRDAKTWADTESVPASAFQQLGVSDDVLRRAGLLKASRSGSGRRRPSERAGRRTTVEDIKEWALNQSGPFTIKDATTALGGSLVTANKALQALVEDGSLASLGPADDHRGPGRAPARFAVSRKRRPRS